MARIDVNKASIVFSVRRDRQVSLKEYIVKGLFRRSLNPEITVHALTDVNLTARDGDRIGIIGHNGAGKTTFLKMLAGIYPPTEGTCEVEGNICSLFDIALGFEQDATGWENIAYRSYLQGVSPATLRKKIDSIGEFSELGEFLTLPVRNYSAGMRMRLAFSIATSADPEVLLIDEVLAAGDMAFQLKARARMRELMSAARLMVLVSHDLNTIGEVCNRVLWLKRGRVMAEGPPAEVVAAYTEDVAARTKAREERAAEEANNAAA